MKFAWRMKAEALSAVAAAKESAGPWRIRKYTMELSLYTSLALNVLDTSTWIFCWLLRINLNREMWSYLYSRRIYLNVLLPC